MNASKIAIFLTLGLLSSSRAEEARFFRVSGPVPTAITGFGADGSITWTNAPTNATFTVQAAQGLTGAPNWVDYVQVPTTNGATTQQIIDLAPPAGMALIPAGSFSMGNSMDTNEGNTDELPLHTVYVSAFYLDRYEVTKAFWDEVFNWAISHGYSFESGGGGKASNHPAHSMRWNDAVKWCNARSEKEGLVPAYYTSADQTTVYRTGTNDLDASFVNWSAGYRLPTEAEWEKAARGGAIGHRFPWSDADTITHSRANYYVYQASGTNYYPYDESLTPGFHPTFNDGLQPYTSPVGYFAPNGYGLYDMAGNVWEMCWDWYGAYGSSSQTDPRGPVSGSGRVGRGGCWKFEAFVCRAAFHVVSRGPASLSNTSGFRCVLPTGQ